MSNGIRVFGVQGWFRYSIVVALIVSSFIPKALASPGDDDSTRARRNTALHSQTTLGTHEYRFANGARLIFQSPDSNTTITSRLSYVPAQGEPRVLVAERVLYSLPVNAGTTYTNERGLQSVFSGIDESDLARTPMTRFHDAASQNARTVDVEIREGMMMVSQNGDVGRFGINKHLVKTMRSGALEYFSRRFIYEEKEYILYSFPYKDKAENGGATGESFLMREDGVHVFLGHHYFSIESGNVVPIEDGIMSIEGFQSSIDLDQLAAESRFNPQFVPDMEVRVKGGDMASIHPVKYVLKKYEDLIAKERGELLREARENDAEVQVREVLTDGVEPLEDTVLQDIRTAWNLKKAGSAVLLGPSGSGKTERIKKQLARAVAMGLVEGVPRTTKMLNLTVTRMTGGNSYVGMNENEVQFILEAAKAFRCILFIDEIHTFSGAGTHSESKVDLMQHLKPGLADGSIRIIGTSTLPEFRAAFHGDTALYNRFIRIDVTRPSDDALVNIARSMEQSEGWPASPEGVIRRLISLSDTYGSTGAQPGRLVRLFDYTQAQVNRPNVVRFRPLTQADGETGAAKLYRLDPVLFSPQMARERLDALPAALDEYLVGIGQFKSQLHRAAKLRLAGITSPKEPAIRLLVAGPSGSGKTEGATVFARAMGFPMKKIAMEDFAAATPMHFLRVLANILTDNSHTVVVLDEIEKAHPDVIQALLGVLNEGTFNLTENINSNSSRSATHEVPVDSKHASFIATTNLAQDYLVQLALDARGQTIRETRRVGFSPGIAEIEASQQAVEQEEREPTINEAALRQELLKGGLSKAVLDRFTRVTGTFPPTKRQFAASVRMHLKRSLKSAQENVGHHRLRSIRFENQEAFVTSVTDRHFVPGISNREAARIVEEEVLLAMAEALNQNPEGQLDLRLSYLAPHDVVVCERVLNSNVEAIDF